MKKQLVIVSLALISFGVISCKNTSKGSKTEKKEVKLTTIEFPETNHDFDNRFPQMSMVSKRRCSRAELKAAERVALLGLYDRRKKIQSKIRTSSLKQFQLLPFRQQRERFSMDRQDAVGADGLKNLLQ